MKCRICNSETDRHGTYAGSALEVSRFYSRPADSKGVELKLYSCPLCGHYQIPYVNTENYYENYVMTVSHSPKMQRLQSEQAETLASFAVNNHSFVEIGCGDGLFLSYARNWFKDVLGIEPSKPYYELSSKRGLKVINEYLTEKLTFDHSFDAFACRQVFEHISNPQHILCLIYGMLGDSAVGLIEVPNAQKMLGENRYFDLFSDHINYFTPQSLCYLSRRSGFEIVMLRESFNRDYLELYVRKKPHLMTMESKRESDFAFLRDAAAKYNDVSAWGAGSKAQAIMTALGSKLNLKYLFDTDVNKHDKYIVNCSTPITGPSQEKVKENDLIIIFSVSYQDEVINVLANDYDYAGDVLCLEGDVPCIRKI